MLKNLFIAVVALFGSALSVRAAALELLEPNEYHIAKPFFEDFKLNQPMLHFNLENRGAGKIYTDDKNNPSFALVCNPVCYTFLAGNLDQTSLREVADLLKTLPRICLIAPLDWDYRHFFEEEGFIPIKRIQFRSSGNLANVDYWKGRLPDQYYIDRIGVTNFNQCEWNLFILDYYGDQEQFFAEGMGFCVLDRDQVISESYGLISDGMAEIVVATSEKYRGQNLGTVVCAFMLDYCYSHNLEPIWSCDVTNPASAAIAKKLGFEKECDYLFLTWISPIQK